MVPSTYWALVRVTLAQVSNLWDAWGCLMLRWGRDKVLLSYSKSFLPQRRKPVNIVLFLVSLPLTHYILAEEEDISNG